ncbi:hypothetical protein [Spiroplasma endosymbiont of Virgichneumon dumeticola]|uniref:hypothetical protein n=1 Tax=Spiroplasma endosymbiont of Virgichneumon dumeticola TaxID=3139323 RepID=UPI0035C915B2
MAKHKKDDNQNFLLQKSTKTFDLEQLFEHGTEVNKNNRFIQELAKRLVDKFFC